MVVALTGISSSSTFAQDESETNTGQEIKQENVGSGESTNNNCALNSIDSAAAIIAPLPGGCHVPPLGPPT